MLALAVAPAAAVAAAPKDAPPEPVVPVQLTTAALLKAHRAAMSVMLTGRHAVAEHWTTLESGVAGTETLDVDGSDYRAEIARGPMREAYGAHGSVRWHQDRNGVVTTGVGNDLSSFEMLVIGGLLGEPDDPKNDVKLVGRTTGAHPQNLLRVKQPGWKTYDWFYFDPSSNLITKMIYREGKTTYTIAYADYADIGDRMLPRKIHETDGDAAFDDDFHMTSFRYVKRFPPAVFDPPASTFGFIQYGTHASLPAKDVMWVDYLPWSGGNYYKIHTPNLVVRLVVNGRGLDFALSSGVARSLIDENVAAQLGLPTFGQPTHDAKGKPVGFDTVIPQATIGTASLHDFAVRAVHFSYHVDESTKIVGVLGYDFLAAGSFKIDFYHGTLDIYPQGAVAIPDNPLTYVLSFHIAGGIPFLDGDVAGHPTKNILIDNDDDLSMVSGRLADAYPGDFKDVVDGDKRSSAMVPFADANDYGEEAQVWTTNVPALNWGALKITGVPMLATDVRFGSQAEPIDAIVGGDLLHFYDVYLDYNSGKMILQPNPWFSQNYSVGAKK